MKPKKALKDSIAPKKSALKKAKKDAKKAKALEKATKAPKKVEASEKRPRMDIESSRTQVLLRSGVSGPGGSTALKWADHGGQVKTIAKGKEWLAGELRKRCCIEDLAPVLGEIACAGKIACILKLF